MKKRIEVRTQAELDACVAGGKGGERKIVQIMERLAGSGIDTRGIIARANSPIRFIPPHSGIPAEGYFEADRHQGNDAITEDCSFRFAKAALAAMGTGQVQNTDSIEPFEPPSRCLSSVNDKSAGFSESGQSEKQAPPREVSEEEFAAVLCSVPLNLSSTRRSGNGLRNADEIYAALKAAGYRITATEAAEPRKEGV